MEEKVSKRLMTRALSLVVVLFLGCLFGHPRSSPATRLKRTSWWKRQK